MTDHTTPPQSSSSSRLLPPWLLRVIDHCGDRANPLLVRIVRQNLRNRAFLSVYFLLLAVGGLLSFIFAASSDAGHSDSDTGQQLFYSLLYLWGFSVIIAQSIMAYRSVVNERQDDTWDLIELSSLEPRHILRGLLYSALTQILMFTAALAPYMMMAYMLRGVDIRLLFFFFMLIPAFGITASVWSIFCACLANKKSTRMFLSLFAFAGAVSLGIWATVLLEGSRWLLRDFGRLTKSWSDILLFVAWCLNIFIMFNFTLLIFSAALLKHRAANRSTGPRAIWIACFLNLLLCCTITSYYIEGRLIATPFLGLSAIGAYMSFILGIYSVSEHFRITPRQARDLTRTNRLLSATMYILGPGAGRGYLAYAGMAIFSLILACIGIGLPEPNSYQHGGNTQVFAHTWAVIAYGAISLTICDYLYRGPFKRFFATPALRRSFVLTFFALYNLILGLLIAFFTHSSFNQHLSTLFSPIFGVITITSYPNSLVIGQWCVAALGLICLTRFIIIGIRKLNPDMLRTTAGDNDHNPRGGN